jgi:hypothetical protein
MHLQALGIRDGRFIGGDKELDLLVEIFMLNVQIYDSSDALHDEAECGDLEYSECVSLREPDSGDRQDVVLFRENVVEYSLLFTQPPKAASPASPPPLAKAPKFTTSLYGEFPGGGNRPRVLPSPSPPPSLSLFILIYFRRHCRSLS